MRVTIDLENLESIVQTTLEKNSEEAIHRALESVVQKEVDKALKSDIDKGCKRNCGGLHPGLSQNCKSTSRK